MLGIISPELVFWVYGLGMGGLAVAKKVKKEILRRDKKCSYPDCLRGDYVCVRVNRCSYDVCQKSLTVHHINPEAYCREKGLPYEGPENMIIVGRAAHELIIHPSRESAENLLNIPGEDYNWRCAIPLCDGKNGNHRQIPIHPDSKLHLEMGKIAKKRTERRKKK